MPQQRCYKNFGLTFNYGCILWRVAGRCRPILASRAAGLHAASEQPYSRLFPSWFPPTEQQILYADVPFSIQKAAKMRNTARHSETRRFLILVLNVCLSQWEPKAEAANASLSMLSRFSSEEELQQIKKQTNGAEGNNFSSLPCVSLRSQLHSVTRVDEQEVKFIFLFLQSFVKYAVAE